MSTKDKPSNSSMTRNIEEMMDHGKVMEEMETNKELKKDGKKPDPEQNKEFEK